MRALLWFVAGCVGLWAGSVWLLRPQTWRALAIVSARINYRARVVYGITKMHEARRQRWQGLAARLAAQQADEPLPSDDDVVDAVRHFLNDQRRDA